MELKYLFETSRLIVRKLTLEDTGQVREVFETEKALKKSFSGAEVENYLNEALTLYEREGFGIWGVIEKKDKKLIGLMGSLERIYEGIQYNELIYWFYRDFWDQEMAWEAVRGTEEYIFKNSDIDRLVSFIESGDERTRQIAEKIGMHRLRSTSFQGMEGDLYEIHKIVLNSYRTQWRETFLKEEVDLLKVFKDLQISFHHIGSTSIPGCDAKPVIDILGVVNDVLQIDDFNGDLEGLGYNALGEYGIKQRRFFRKRNDPHVNLHIFEDSDPEVARYLRFCDYLSSHPEETVKYSKLKRQLAEEYPNNIVRYILGKEKFIKGIDYHAALDDTGKFWNRKLLSRKSFWKENEIQNAMETNMQLHMTYFAKYLPHIEVIYEPDVTIVLSTLKDDSFNYVIDNRFAQKDVIERVSYVLDLFKAKDLPFSWWVGQRDTPENLGDILLKFGLQPKEDDIGMFMNLDHAQLNRKIPELSIERALDQTSLHSFSEVFKRIGGSDVYEDFFSKIPPVLYGDGSPYEIYVGFLNGEPVVTGILVLHANVGGIYYVMTDPSHRKKGYGTEIMEFLLIRAKERGYHVATLQASFSGRNLYQRLGFEPICRFVEYA